MNSTTILVFSFVGVFAVVLLAFSVGWQYVEAQRKKKVVGMLENPSGSSVVVETTILKDLPSSGGDFFGRILENLNLAKKIQEQIHQAGMTWTTGKLLLTMLLAGVAGAIIGLRLKVMVVTWASSLALAALFAAVPYLNILRRRGKRLAAFEAQFPEALDFLSRAMRAGHAFSVSLEMLSEESPDPLAREFRQVYNEQNLGMSIDTALKNLTKRVPLLDVGFFVSAVMLQKETGGNLSEILNKLSYVIRERFKLKGQVRAASSHGRMTGLILTLMPVATVFAMIAIAPEYLRGLVEDPDGKWLIIGTIVGQMLGYFFIRRIINIKV
jgi:tight adherence protein B